MSYISELRKYIGHQPIIHIGATVLVFNENNEILLNLRADTGTWGIIGGGMEPGESLEETAARELLSTGYKNFAFVHAPERKKWSEMREREASRTRWR